MKKYSAVVFDLDGTLLNTLGDLHGAVNHTLQTMGFPLRTQDEVRLFVGNGIRKLIQRSLPENHKDEGTVSEAYRIFCNFYEEHCADLTAPYDGIPELIARLSKEGLPMSVVSNKDEDASIRLCSRFFGDGAFVSVLGSRPDRPRKPDPSGVFSALSAMGGSPRTAVYVGDSDVDFFTAANAGMDCILASWGFRGRAQLEKLPNAVIVDDTEQLLSLLSGKKE